MSGPYVARALELKDGSRLLVWSDGSLSEVVWHGGMVDELGTKGGILDAYESRSSWSVVRDKAKYDQPKVPFADDNAANNERAAAFGSPVLPRL